MQKKFATAIDEHRLRNEIVATKLANRIVNRLGVLHPFELAEEEGAAMATSRRCSWSPSGCSASPRCGKRIETAQMAKARVSPCSTRVAVACAVAGRRSAARLPAGRGPGRSDRAAQAKGIARSTSRPRRCCSTK
jgi:glutamate dehydrogenase